MELEERDYYDEKYEMISYLLLKFLLASYYPGMTDEDTIRGFVAEMCAESIAGSLKEGRELLQLQPFPWEWVSGVSNRLVYDKAKQDWVEDAGLYKEWVSWMMEALEAEAKRAGKL